MIQQPGITLEAHTAGAFSVTGPMADRIASWAWRWCQYTERTALPGCHIHVTQSAPAHVGLGTGTQLALSTAALLYSLFEGTRPDALQLAMSVGRLGRSSVGTHGFDLGGLLYEVGKLPGEPLGALADRVALPDLWCVVQIRPIEHAGRSGIEEVTAFAQLPAVPPRVTEQLTTLVHEELLPAARRGALDEFGECVYRYGHLAGLCFASSQAGAYASDVHRRWVERLRRRGYLGVGQSSWGPTLFVFTPHPAAAEELIAWFRRDVAGSDSGQVPCSMTRIANHGATLEWRDSADHRAR
jgi:beta-RFAP synthase